MKKVVCLIGFVSAMTACGPSKAELWDDYEDCYDRYVRPIDQKIEDTMALSRYLEDLPAGSQLSGDQILNIILNFNLDVPVQPGNVSGTAKGWDDALHQTILPQLYETGQQKLEECDDLYSGRF